MHGRHALACIEDGLLGHTEMYEIGCQLVEKLFESGLLSQGKVLEISGSHLEVVVLGSPVRQVVTAHKYRVMVGGIDFF